MAKKKASTKAKSIKKKVPAESIATKKSGFNWKSFNFIVVLILFCGVSMYAIFTFFLSTNDYLKSMYTSVVGEAQTEVVVPDSCKPCTDVPECAQFCKVEPYEIFRDVSSDHPMAGSIERLKDAGIIKGYEDGNFKPGEKITRTEALVIMTNALDADFSGKVYANCFNDVQDQWFAPYVCYSREKGYISGYVDGTYQPNAFVKKVEALKMLFTAFDYDIPDKLEVQPYEDTPIDSWFAPYAYLARQKSIIRDNTVFDPLYELTRADYAQMVYSVMKDKGLIY